MIRAIPANEMAWIIPANLTSWAIPPNHIIMKFKITFYEATTQQWLAKSTQTTCCTSNLCEKHFRIYQSENMVYRNKHIKQWQKIVAHLQSHFVKIYCSSPTKIVERYEIFLLTLLHNPLHRKLCSLLAYWDIFSPISNSLVFADKTENFPFSKKRGH